ncbi:MAG TPA: shikimate dehydrogenase [Thermomicrobiales bacterium]|nr:shikimate dehydrogenase [Thermomicrobiales bacterium]
MTDVAAVRTKFRLGVIGDPVAHSISPAIQQAAFDAIGLPTTYERWQTSQDELNGRIASLRADDVLGANVTVPHKQAVMPFLDEVRPVALRAGAVNTIVHRDGHLSGDNTDVYGFQAALAGAGVDAAARSALVLGAGGAAHGVILGLAALEVTRTLVWNRNAARAHELAADLGSVPLIVCDSSHAALQRAVAGASLLINATSVGWHGDEVPIPLAMLDQLGRDAVVMDLTYRDTAFLRAARARGMQTLDGLPMLVYQGARAFELWTGKDAPVEVMFDAARRARAS